MKTSNHWQFLHRQLFCGFLVAKTSRTLDLSRRSQVLCPGESLQTVLQGSGNRSRAVASGDDFRAGWRTEVQGNIPKGVYCCRDTAAVNKNKITVKTSKFRTSNIWNSYYWQAWQTTSDCKPPVKIWSMIHVHRLTEFSWGWVDCCSFGPLFKIIDN